MKRTVRNVVAVATLPALAGIALIITKPALADTGNTVMQAQFCQGKDTNFDTIAVRGTNQNGDFSIPQFATIPGACTTTWGYWWQGTLEVIFTTGTSGDGPGHGQLCKIDDAPRVQPDVVSCPVAPPRPPSSEPVPPRPPELAPPIPGATSATG